MKKLAPAKTSRPVAETKPSGRDMGPDGGVPGHVPWSWRLRSSAADGRKADGEFSLYSWERIHGQRKAALCAPEPEGDASRFMGREGVRAGGTQLESNQPASGPAAHLQPEPDVEQAANCSGADTGGGENLESRNTGKLEPALPGSCLPAFQIQPGHHAAVRRPTESDFGGRRFAPSGS